MCQCGKYNLLKLIKLLKLTITPAFISIKQAKLERILSSQHEDTTYVSATDTTKVLRFAADTTKVLRYYAGYHMEFFTPNFTTVVFISLHLVTMVLRDIRLPHAVSCKSA